VLRLVPIASDPFWLKPNPCIKFSSLFAFRFLFCICAVSPHHRIQAAVGITTHVNCPLLLSRTFSFQDAAWALSSFFLFQTLAWMPDSTFSGDRGCGLRYVVVPVADAAWLTYFSWARSWFCFAMGINPPISILLALTGLEP
jgi:hypothetical protein